MTTPAQREAVAQWLRDNNNGPWPGSSESYLIQANEIIAAYEAAKDAENQRPPGPPEWGFGDDDRELMGDWCSPAGAPRSDPTSR